MLKKLNKLANDVKKYDIKFYNSIISIANKVDSSRSDKKKYLLIDVRRMESMVAPEKVDVEDHMDRVELKL